MEYHNHENIPRASYQPNELNERVVGMPALNPFFRSVSGPRAAMFNKHISQRPTIINPTSQRLVTGVGHELGKYTYKLKLPAGAYIVDVVHKHTKTLFTSANFRNPLSTVIFEHADTQVIDILDLPRHHSQHQYFGFEYKYDVDAIGEIRPENRILHDIIIADSPAKGMMGEYKFGMQANMTLMSDEVGIEDGIKISESFCKKLAFNCFETRQINFTNNGLGLNLYGDENNYKLFPDIGEKIRPDGKLFGLRELGDNLAPALLSSKSLMEPTLYDTCVYGKPGAEIVDIEVVKGSLQQPVFFSGMEDQLERYHQLERKYYDRIYEVYNKVKKIYGDSLRISPAFSRLVREAIAVRLSEQTPLSYRGRTRLTGWLVNVTYKTTLIPTDGFKLTDLMG